MNIDISIRQMTWLETEVNSYAEILAAKKDPLYTQALETNAMVQSKLKDLTELNAAETDYLKAMINRQLSSLACSILPTYYGDEKLSKYFDKAENTRHMLQDLRNKFQ